MVKMRGARKNDLKKQKYAAFVTMASNGKSLAHS